MRTDARHHAANGMADNGFSGQLRAIETAHHGDMRA